MSSLSIEDVKKLASSSALELRDEEVAPLQKELAAILDYVRQLQTVDTTGVEPTYQVGGLENVTRADEIIDYGVSPDDLLRCSSRVEGHQIVVPRVVE